MGLSKERRWMEGERRREGRRVREKCKTENGCVEVWKINVMMINFAGWRYYHIVA